MPLHRTPRKGHDSEGSSTEESKRKRWEESADEDSDLVKKTRVALKSPRKASDEDLKGMMKEMLTEIKAIRVDQKSYQKEMNELRKENKLLKQEVGHLEDKMERLEKQLKKRNIIIKGHEFKDNEGSAEVEKFITEKLDIEVKIRDIRKIKGNEGKLAMAIAEVDSWEAKEKIMKNKSKLRGTNCYIDNDLTKTEEHIQRELRNRAKTEREKGNTVRVGYQKIRINELWWKWNPTVNMLEKIGNKQEEPDPKNR